jgi:hypothetical protein
MKKTLFHKIGRTLSVLTLVIALSATPTMATPFFGSEKHYVCSQPDAYGNMVDVYEVKTYAFGFEVSSKMVFEFAP